MSTSSDPSFTIRPIGLVHSPFTSVEGMPIQAAAAMDQTARVEVFEEFAPGLRDIEGFEYLVLMTRFHVGSSENLNVIPFMDVKTHGVFSTRSPARPNRLGLTIVKLEKVSGRFLEIRGNDMLDQTPVIDIKPYVPALDAHQTENIGWYKDRLFVLPTAKSDSRMAD